MATKVVSKSAPKKTSVQKKAVVKKPAVKAAPKKTADEIAFDKFIAKNENLAKKIGKGRLFEVFLAGVRRGRATR